MILAAKIATLIGWIVIVANWIQPFGGDIQDILHYSGLGLAAAHAIETAIFLPKAKALPGNIAVHALQIFLFGYAHNMAMDAELAKAA